MATKSKLSEIEKLFASKLNLADKKLQAEKNVQAEIHKNKEEILREFCQPIWEFMLYVHHKTDVRFAKATTWGTENLIRLINTYGGNNADTTYNEKSYNDGMEKLSHCFDTAVGYITFAINDSYQPYAYFGSYGSYDIAYTSAEQFIDVMTDKISRRKK